MNKLPLADLGEDDGRETRGGCHLPLPKIAQEVRDTTALVAAVIGDEDDGSNNSGSWGNGDACIRVAYGVSSGPCK